MKRFIAIFLALIMTIGLAGCSGGNQTPSSPTVESSVEQGNAASEPGAVTQQYTLNVSGLDGSLTMLPVWIAEQKGWFEEAGLTVNRTGFTNGPVQMEAIDAWDIGLTGVGGVLSGCINYDAILIGTVGTDDEHNICMSAPIRLLLRRARDTIATTLTSMVTLSLGKA